MGQAMSDIQPLSDAELKLLRQNFAEESVAQELSGALDDEKPKHAIGLSELYNYAHKNSEHIDTDKIETALASSPAIRNAFRRIITGMVFYRSGEALAASDPGPIPRSGNGFSIRYQTANTVPGHIYVIIELDGNAPALKNILYVFDEMDKYTSFPLSSPRNGIIQILVSVDNPLLQLLSDPKTEVMLG